MELSECQMFGFICPVKILKKHQNNMHVHISYFSECFCTPAFVSDIFETAIWQPYSQKKIRKLNHMTFHLHLRWIAPPEHLVDLCSRLDIETFIQVRK